jgi:4-hydroxybutyrate dehydrogenase / sulfolactaldehyde 3-reductase
MASNLQTKGFATLSFDINPEPVAALTKLGGVGARSAEEVARGSDFIFTMLPASQEVRSVVLGSILPNSKPGTLIVDMSTIDPLTTDEIAAAVTAAGLAFVDAPVGRLATHADRGESLFMVGASPENFARVKPMLEAPAFG